jgi:orotate phosphoribosyltransferase
MIDRVAMQERNLDRLVRNDGFQFTDTFFPYTSGQIGPYYVQSAVVTANGEDYAGAVDDLDRLVKSYVSDDLSRFVVAGGESRDWVFSFPFAKDNKLPHFGIYKNGKVHWKGVGHRDVLLVSDLNNEGSSPENYWVPAIKGEGGFVNHAFFYVDRLEDGVGVLEKLQLKNDAVVPLNGSAWDYLRSRDIVNGMVYNNLRDRMEDKGVWAEKMLRSDEGFNEFFRLASNSKTFEKAQKVLFNGYPDLIAELADRLRERGVEILE